MSPAAARAAASEANQAKSKADPDAFVSVQSIVIDPADRLWVLDTGSPLFEETQRGGPKLVCIDLTTDEITQTILFEPDVALPTTYLNDVRFDLRQGEAGFAYITDSSDQGPNGIIVVDLASGAAWRRLHDHPTTKALPPGEMVPVAEGRVFAERSAGEAAQIMMAPMTVFFMTSLSLQRPTLIQTATGAQDRKWPGAFHR